MIGVEGMLTAYGIVGVDAIDYGTTPILLVATHLAVAGVLARHERRPAGSTDRTAGISLCKTHSLCCQTVYVGGVYIRLTIAS